MYLVPETRQVTKTDETLEELIIQALIDGPATKELTRTVPKETKLLSISVADGVAYANFSQELKTKHWGGSAGEMMTIYSIVNSLARLEGIEKVQFLIEGNKEESIFGHMYTGEPIEPNWNLVKRGQGSA
ncbi:MAG: GerMN domain-containing protein [Peptococcaceae bacterium]|nr:GerMN domain-containing protein [Peptococcaceae bacterium]